MLKLGGHIRSWPVRAAAGIFLSFAASGCRSVPLTGREQLLLTTPDYEQELGAQAYQEQKQQYRRSGNAEYNAALARVGEALKKAAHQDDFAWEFIVFESPVRNAFCLPGGKVAVYSGLMDVMKNEAELACVVAHETGHAIARHGGERMSWEMLRNLGALGVAVGLRNEAANQIYGLGTEYGVMLPFSRKHEYEADRIGLFLMAEAGYDPRAAVEFWRRFGRFDPLDRLNALASTHPCDADRLREFQKNMSRALDLYRRAEDRKGYGMTFSRRR